MKRMTRLKYVPLAFFAATIAATAINGCAAAKDAASATGCDGLSATVSAQATLKGYAQAAVKLRDQAIRVEAKFLDVCNKMNAKLGEDATKTTATEACGILQARVKKATDAGVTVALTIDPFSCTANVNAQASCEGTCNVQATCDVKAKCDPGKVVVACMGTCSAECDVKAPDFACSGMCQGSCTADAAVACSGVCEGTCDAPTFKGTCDVGCTAGFSGTCGGMCMGKCDGADSTGTCMGKCEGTCSAQASGECAANARATSRGHLLGHVQGKVHRHRRGDVQRQMRRDLHVYAWRRDLHGRMSRDLLGRSEPPALHR